MTPVFPQGIKFRIHLYWAAVTPSFNCYVYVESKEINESIKTKLFYFSLKVPSHFTWLSLTSSDHLTLIRNLDIRIVLFSFQKRAVRDT